MRAARLIFGAAAIYGLIVLVPLFFVESRLVPAPTRPEDYFGFLSAATVFQLVYLAIARDPVRLRPIMPLGVLAKWGYFVPVLLLHLQGRVPATTLAFASVDALLGIAFLFAWRATPAQ